MKEVVIVDYARSAFGKRGGALKGFYGSTLGGLVLKRLVEKSKIMEKGKLDSVFGGSSEIDAEAYTTPRYMAQVAGLPFDIPGTTVEMACGTAITAINHAAWKIMAGAADVIIAGGVESHSTWPARFDMTVEPYKGIKPHAIPERLSPYDEENTSQVENADRIAAAWGLTREECDLFAYNSQQRLARAYESGLIGPEIVPVTIPGNKKTPAYDFVKDEHPRPDITLEALGKLKPVFEGGMTTAGNASGLNDGAAFVLMMSREKAEEYGYTPLARWVWGNDTGANPSRLDLCAGRAMVKVAKEAGIKFADLDVIECNEAFAAQNLGAMREIERLTGEKIDMEKWNPNGGAIAIGHPNAASGARIAMFAMRQLAATGGKYGMIASCCGGGQGTATILENLVF